MNTAKLLSAKDILSKSFGQVTVAATFRRDKAVEGGLYCEKIFGPVNNYKCQCGAVSGIHQKGITCPTCGVVCDHSRIRRERMGHISLLYPVVHPFFVATLAKILGVSAADVEDISLHKTGFTMNSAGKLSIDENGATGAISLYQVVSIMEPDNLEAYSKEASAIIALLASKGNHPRDLFLTELPVFPAGLRATSRDTEATSHHHADDDYSLLIKVQNKLTTMRDFGVPNEIELAVARSIKWIVEKTLSGLKRVDSTSFLNDVSGKQGRFRGNLLGKRVDFSGRTILTGSPRRRLNECGLPRTAAYVLFEPFILRYLLDSGICNNYITAKRIYKNKDLRAIDALDAVAEDKYVFVNRQPSLHAYSAVGLKVKLLGRVR